MDIDTKKIDFERAAMLLNLIEKQSTVAPRATHLSGAAHSELMKINDAIKEAATKAEIKRREIENRPKNEILEPDAQRPDGTDPDPELERKLDASAEAANARRQAAVDNEPNDPVVYPGDSQTATIADRRI